MTNENEMINLPKAEFDRLRKIESNINVMHRVFTDARAELTKKYSRPHIKIERYDDVIATLEALLT